MAVVQIDGRSDTGALAGGALRRPQSVDHDFGMAVREELEVVGIDEWLDAARVPAEP